VSIKKTMRAPQTDINFSWAGLTGRHKQLGPIVFRYCSQLKAWECYKHDISTWDDPVDGADAISLGDGSTMEDALQSAIGLAKLND